MADEMPLLPDFGTQNANPPRPSCLSLFLARCLTLLFSIRDAVKISFFYLWNGIKTSVLSIGNAINGIWNWVCNLINGLKDYWRKLRFLFICMLISIISIVLAFAMREGVSKSWIHGLIVGSLLTGIAIPTLELFHERLFSHMDLKAKVTVTLAVLMTIVLGSISVILDVDSRIIAILQWYASVILGVALGATGFQNVEAQRKESRAHEQPDSQREKQG